MKNLIDLSTPANNIKKMVFQQMVHKEDGTKLVIDMTIEMGSSVDYTLNMLKNILCVNILCIYIIL